MRKKTILTGLLLGVLTLLLLTPDIAMAADSIEDILGGGSKSMTASDFSDKVIDFGEDINKGTSFTTEFQKIFLGMNTVFRSIITILTVAAGAMIAFGIEDGKKTAWQFMLGIGLAYNFGWFLFEVFGNTGILMSVDDIAKAHQGTNAAVEILKNSKENGNDDILSEIMAVYSGTIINNGMPVLQAIALRMTIALAALEGGYKIAMDLYNGDKVKFMLTYVFKAGFFCFLIMEWLNIGQALSGLFQAAGFLAAGESGFSTVDPASADADTTFRPDSIWHNATAFLMLALTGKKAGDSDPGFGFWDAAKEAGILSLAGGVLTAATGGVGALLGPVVVLLFVLFIVGLMFFISVEMFVARIEFYTMLMLSVVFLPFGVTERLAFLSNSAISLMFNSGAKMMVISFLQVMIAKILSSYLLKLKVNPFDPSHLAVLCQLAIMCVFFAYITKKIPDLVASFLNGSPALSGGGMIGQATSMASKAATVAGAGVGSMAGAAGGAAKTLSTMKDANGAIGKMSTLGKAGAQFVGGTAWNMAKTGMGAALTNNSIAGGFAKGVKMAVGSDGTMANASFARKVRDLAGLNDQSGNPILGKAMGKKYEPESSKSDGEDKEKEKATGGGNKGENTNQPNPQVFNNANASEGKKTTINSVVNNMNQQVANTQDNKNHNYNMSGPQAQNNQTGGTKTDGVVGSAKTDGTVQQAGVNQQTKNTNNQQIQNIQKGDNGGGGTPPDGAISRMKK